jgi:hypothetical protein
LVDEVVLAAKRAHLETPEQLVQCHCLAELGKCFEPNLAAVLQATIDAREIDGFETLLLQRPKRQGVPPLFILAAVLLAVMLVGAALVGAGFASAARPEWEILIILRNSTGYSGWVSNADGWANLEEHKDPSQCAGVVVDNAGKVLKLELGDSNLTGALPHEIVGLSSLGTLNLEGNALTALPLSLAQLSSLQDLNIGGNQRLFGNPELFLEADEEHASKNTVGTQRAVENLRALELLCNGNRSRLQTLRLWGLDLATVPRMGGCTALTYVNLDENPRLDR